MADRPRPGPEAARGGVRRSAIAAGRRRRGCPAWKCGEYLTWLEKRRRERRRPPTGEKPASIGPVEADRWLAAFGDLDRDPAWDELFGPFDDGAAFEARHS